MTKSPQIEVYEGVAVRKLDPPPDDFDPFTADAAELRLWGLPPRPEGTDQRRSWETALRRPLTYITPTFALTGRRRQTFDDPESDGPTWSGMRAAAPEGTWMNSVSGRWTVPNTYPPGRGDLQSYECSSWVGIDDGTQSADIIQAGVHSIVYDFPNFGLSTASSHMQVVYPWWEWVPGPEVAITNFPVLPGDTVWVSIYAFSPQEAQISLWNMGPGAITNFNVTNDPAVAFEFGEEFAGSGMPDIAGVCAEWIVERPQFRDAQGQIVPVKLANYGSVFFYLMGAGASRDDGSTELPTAYETITMTSNAGVLSSSSGRIVTQDAGTYTSTHCTFHRFE